MPLASEIKRKLFHHLSLGYLLLYAILPRWVTILLLGVALAALGVVEFLRLRRPELNAWFLAKFGGIHRDSEIMNPSGIFWTLLGCWLTMVIFIDKGIGITGIGFLVFGDTAAALAGQAWGRRPWTKNPKKTKEGTAAFAVVSLIWGLLMVKPHGALVGALFTAWVESLPTKINDNFWIPLAGAFSISLCLGGKMISGNPYIYLAGRPLAFSVVFLGVVYFLFPRERAKSDAP